MARLDLTNWRDCGPYLEGVRLFNRGQHWEAHEAWEGLWHAAGRRGAVANFLKGLIKLAAAAVKARAGVPAGFTSHAARAVELLDQTQEHLGGVVCGLNVQELAERARRWAADPAAASECLSYRLRLLDEPSHASGCEYYSADLPKP